MRADVTKPNRAVPTKLENALASSSVSNAVVLSIKDSREIPISNGKRDIAVSLLFLPEWQNQIIQACYHEFLLPYGYLPSLW